MACQRQATKQVVGQPTMVGLVLTVLSILVACRQTTEQERQRAVRWLAASFARLETTSQTRHHRLRQELARLADANQLPMQLAAERLVDPQQGGPAWRHGGRRVLDRDNVAVGIREAFASVDVAVLSRDLERYLPTGELSVPLKVDPEMRRWLARQQSLRVACRRALERPDAQLAIRYTEGLLADLSVIQQLVWAGQLLLCEAVVALANEDVSLALDDCRRVFRAIELLAGEPHLTARVAAARLRSDALRFVQVLVLSRAVGRDAGQQLKALLRSQLDQWPPDELAWIGQRALGMHAYEMVRQGHLLSLLSYKELAKHDTPELARLCRLASEYVDEDQWFYLQTMQKILKACRLPYYRRGELLAQLREELAVGADPEQKRFVARVLLFDEFDWGQRIQAHDRACTEGWALALGLALGQAGSTAPINPLTGEPFDYLIQDGTVYVSRVDTPDDKWQPLPQPLRVPQFTMGQPSVTN